MNKKLIFSLLAFPFVLAACSGTSDSGNDEAYTPYTLGDGPIYVEKFSDFQCPACANMDARVTPFVKENLDSITFAYKHFPLSQHREARPAAQAAECAGLQGQFFEYKDQIFANQSRLGSALYNEIATDLQLDETAFQSCLNDRDIRNAVSASAREGSERNVNSTPTFFVSVGIQAPQKVDNNELIDYLEQQIAELDETEPAAQEVEPETQPEPEESLEDDTPTETEEEMQADTQDNVKSDE